MNFPATPEDLEIYWNKRKKIPPKTLRNEAANVALQKKLAKFEEKYHRDKYLAWLKKHAPKGKQVAFVKKITRAIAKKLQAAEEERDEATIQYWKEARSLLSPPTISRIKNGERPLAVAEFRLFDRWIDALGESLTEMMDYRSLAIELLKIVCSEICSVRLERNFPPSHLPFSVPQINAIHALSLRSELSDCPISAVHAAV